MDQDFIIPYYLDFRETIGSSTNRGYQLADTAYLAYTDVDDTRPADAFVELLQTLEKNPDIDFTYGNFLVVPEQGATKGQMIETIEFDRNEFTRSSHVGPGHCFRRSLLKQSGYWDEQLRSGGDFDFQIRAAVHGKFKKTYKNVVYYTSDQTQSASSTSWQAIATTNATMTAGYGYFVNTSSSAITMTLPSSPSLGDEVSIIDYAGTFDTNNLTVGRNSQPIMGTAADLTVSTERAGFTLVYVDSTQGWLLRDK